MNAMRRINRCLSTNYYVTLARWHIQSWLADWRGRESIIVYQMGKVGSSTIVASLKAVALRRRIHHVHTLTPEGIAERDAIYRKMCREAHTTYFPRARHLLSSRYLHQKLQQARNGKGNKGQRWKVITLVREPVARNISEFFQVIDYELPDFTARYNAGEITIETAIETFLNRFDHEGGARWFDCELKPALGIDLYAEPFPKAKGYAIYRGEYAELLLIKLEQMEQCAAAAFREFLGIDHFRLVKANVAEEKQYATAYKQFKHKLVLPPAYLKEMYSSKYMQHFYSEAEIAAFRAKW